MRRWAPRLWIPLATALVATYCTSSGASGILRVSGSTTVNPVAADAAEVLRSEMGMRITVDSQGGSSGGIAQLGQGQVEIAMSSRPVTDEDRARYPGTSFATTMIGTDAVGVVVSREVYDGGVRSLDRDQLRALFEARVGSWAELGGPDIPVFVYDKEPGRGTREVLDAYLYGPGGNSPPPPESDRFAIVGGNEEARAKAASTPGAITPLSVAFVEGSDDLVAVAVDGIEPTDANVRDGRYPIARGLFLVTDGPPAGDAKAFVDYVLSPPGQQLVVRHGYLPRPQPE